MELSIEIMFLFVIIIILTGLFVVYKYIKNKNLLEKLRNEENEVVKERILNNLPPKYKSLTEPSKDVTYGIINEKIEKKYSSNATTTKTNKPIGWTKAKNYDDDVNEIENKRINKKEKPEDDAIDMKTEETKFNIKTSVLLVDDSITIRKYIGDILKKMNFDVHIKNNGEEAFEYINTHLKNFDLIITDIEMPKMNGDELVKNIRINKKFKNVPILVISAHAERHLRLMEEEMIQGFMHKPFDNQEFKNQVNYILNL